MSISTESGAAQGTESLRSDEFVQSFARGLSVIRALGGLMRPATLSEVAQASGLPRAAARRILLTLVHLRYVEQRGRDFSLLPRTLELGYSYLSALGVPDLVQPILIDLATKTGESCGVSVLDGDDIVYLARVPTRKLVTISVGVGTRLPAYATSMGRIMLGYVSAQRLDALLAKGPFPARAPKTLTDPAQLAERILADHEQGYSLIDEELEAGLCSMAVPVLNSSGRIVAALSLGAQRSSYSPAQMRQHFLPLLRETTQRLTVAIGTRMTAI